MLIWTLGAILSGTMIGYGISHLFREAGMKQDPRISTALLLAGVGTTGLFVARVLVG